LKTALFSEFFAIRAGFCVKKKRPKMGVFYDFLVGWIAGKEQKKNQKSPF